MSTIETREKFVDALIHMNFEKEIRHIEKMFELFMRSFKFISTHEKELLTKQDYAKWSILLLFIRNLRILRCAYHAMLKGYYDVSIGIQRMAFENHLLMFFFMHKEEEAKKWWFGKRFKPKFLKEEVKERLSYDAVYGKLSKFVHANFETTRFFWEPVGKQGKQTSVWITDYIPKDFYHALHGLLLFGVSSLLIIIPTIFRDKFKDEPLIKEIRDFNAIDKVILKEALEKVREKG